MRQDFAFLLSSVLASLRRTNQQFALLGGAADDIPMPFPKVVPCHPQFGHEMSTTVVFDIWQVVARRHSADTSLSASALPSPQEYADRVVQLFSEDPNLHKWFSIESAGGGHLNASPTPAARTAYLQKVTDILLTDPSKLFEWGSLLFPDAGNLASPPYVNSAAFEIRWNINPRYHRNSDLAAFRDYTDSGRRAGPADVLMWLSLLADADLGSQPYLDGLETRENSPWWLDEFVRHARVVLDSSLRPAMPLSDHEGNSEALLPWPPVLAEFRQVLDRYLYDFTSIWLESREHQRPDRLMGFLLDMVKSWYVYYNRPTVRASLCLQRPFGTSAEREAMSRLTTAVLALTEVTLAQFRIC